MKHPKKRETLKAPTKPTPKPAVEEKKIAEKPAVVTPAPEKPEPAPTPAPHERYEHPERNA